MIIFPGKNFLSKNTEKSLKNAENQKISICNYPHIDGHDTMNPYIKKKT